MVYLVLLFAAFALAVIVVLAVAAAAIVGLVLVALAALAVDGCRWLARRDTRAVRAVRRVATARGLPSRFGSSWLGSLWDSTPGARRAEARGWAEYKVAQQARFAMLNAALPSWSQGISKHVENVVVNKSVTLQGSTEIEGLSEEDALMEQRRERSRRLQLVRERAEAAWHDRDVDMLERCARAAEEMGDLGLAAALDRRSSAIPRLSANDTSE